MKSTRNTWAWSALGIIVSSLGAGCDRAAVDPEPVSSTGQTGQTGPAALTLADRIAACGQDPRVQLGLVSVDVCVGADLFFREPFGGNGRTCATCHPAAHNFTVDPPFIATLPPTDPLFIAEQNGALAQLEKPALMRQFGLILENVDDTTNPTQRFVMRSVPHCFSLATSVVVPAVPGDGTTLPPNERTGWSGDGAPNPGGLRDFQTGAIRQHYTRSLSRTEGTDFVLATPDELTRIEAFLRTIGRSNELALTSLALSDPDAESGRTTFISPAARCNGCHKNAGANVAPGFNRNFDTGVERLRIGTLNAQGIPFDGGFGGPGVATFNFDADKDGINDAFGNGTFNTPPLIEAADTGPFFHTNAFTTIEDAISFYNTSAFNTSPAGLAGTTINLTSTQIANVGRFLRVLNAAFNCQLALTRIQADIAIIGEFKNHSRDVQQTLAALALAEVNDALADLSGVSGLNASAQAQLTAAAGFLQTASTNASHVHRLDAAGSALAAVSAANDSLSASPTAAAALTFTMGAGSLMF